MGSKEPGKRKAKQSSTPGLMTRGRLQKLQGQDSPQSKSMRAEEDSEYQPKIQGTSSQEEKGKYPKMEGNWYPQPVWPQGHMVRMPEGQKLVPKQPGYYMPQINPQMPKQVTQQFVQQMDHRTPQMGQMPFHPVQLHQMGIHLNQMMPQHPLQQMNKKIPPMGPMMIPGMRNVQFPPKSPQQPSPLMTNIMNMQNMPPMNNLMNQQMFRPVNPKSPTFIKHQVIRNRYSKPTTSPKNMETFLNETMVKEEKVDLNMLLREEITTILKEELDRLNDLHKDDKMYEPGYKEREEKQKEQQYKYVNMEEIVDTLIEGFKPTLEVMWNEAKKSHQYSLDEYYYALTQKEDKMNQEEKQTINKVRKKNRKKSNKYKLVVVRDYSRIKNLFQKKDEIEKLMASYRNLSRMTFGNNYFTFSNFNRETNHTDGEKEQSKEEKEDVYLKKAMEYAEVASNQKMLLNNVTALDLREALSGDYLSNYLPNLFRIKLIEGVNSLHFDLGTPPQLSPKITKQVPDEEKIGVLCDTLESFQNAEQLSQKSSSARQHFQPYNPNYKLYSRDARLKELMSQPGGLNKNFNVPSGINLFPNLPPNTINIQQNMPKMPMNMPNMGKQMVMPPGPPKNFIPPPGVMPPQMPMVMPPHMQNNNPYYNK